MSKNETLDEIPTDNLEGSFEPTGATKILTGKPVHVIGRSTWRGPPSELTKEEKIGDDGKEQKYACKVAEKFECTIKDEEVEASQFYITELMYNQLDRLVPDDTSIDMLFKEGKKTGTLYVVKRKNLKPGKPSYWSFVNENQLKEIETE